MLKDKKINVSHHPSRTLLSYF